MKALIGCRVCGQQVSPNARMCPHCGERTPQPYRDRFKDSLLGLLAIALILMVVSGIIMVVYWLAR